MGKYHLRGSHVNLIARTHIRYSIRGGSGLLFVLFALIGGLMIAAFIMDPVSGMKDQMERQGQDVETGALVQEVVQEIGIPAIKRFTSGSDEQAVYLALEKPALVSAFIVIFVFFLPFFVSLGSFNQYAGDIGNRGLRYQLLRTERVNIFVGRFIGTYLFILLVLAALMAIVFLYLVIKAQFYPAADVFLWMLQAYLAIALYALPWVALCGWVSTFIDSSFGSLVLGQAIIFFWPFLVWMGERMNDAVGYGSYIMPWGWKWWLFHPDISRFLIAAVVMLGFTAVFGYLGLRHFSRRDL